MAKKIADRTAYKELVSSFRELRKKTMGQPSLIEKDFFYSKLDKETIQMYYQVKRNIKSYNVVSTEIKELIKRMPNNIWLLRKYVFEFLIIFTLLIIFFFYVKFVPVFKGYLPVFMCFSVLVCFFLRRAIWNLDADLTHSIGALIKAIEGEMKELKKLEK